MIIFVRQFSLVSQNLFNLVVFKNINLGQHKREMTIVWGKASYILLRFEIWSMNIGDNFP